MGEFNEILHGALDKLLRDHVIICRLVSSYSLDEILDVYDVNVKDDVCSFRVKISMRNDTKYRFLVSMSPSNDYIVPILSEIVSMNDTIVNQVNNGNDSLLYCYRSFEITHNDKLIIKEEYGNTLGSHVYDCSIILYKYILQNHQQFIKSNKLIDLGAGCGIIGLLFAKLGICLNVFLTDQSNQLPLIQENIKLNNVENSTSTIISYELDWDNNEQIDSFINDNGQPDYIIGSDVLYSKTMAISLFNAISLLAVPYKTKILIAQKIRESHHDTHGVDITCFPNFIFKKVLVDANVIIWEIYKD